MKTHALSGGHARNCKIQKVEVVKIFTISKHTNWDRTVAIAELKFAAAHTYFNFAYKNSGLLCKIIRNIDPTSIFSVMKVGSTKVRDLVVKVIAWVLKEELANELKQTNFSISLDESTDSGKQKVLVINVRYFCSKKNTIVTKLWDMPTVFVKGKKADAGAKIICKIVMDSFQKWNINILNIVSCCTDGCSTMIGDKSGLKTRMIKKIPHLIWLACPAHKTHLIANHSMNVLPPYILQMLTNFHTMLKSAHRKQNFTNLQEQLGLPTHKIPRFVAVRWLSLELCVNRALQQWQALYIFSKCLKKDAVAQKVYRAMRKPETKCYLYLLQHVLYDLNLLNKFFQRDDVVINQSANQIERTYKKIISCIINWETLSPLSISEIKQFEEKNYYNYEDVQLGEEIRHYINKNGIKMKKFLKRAFKYVSCVCMEMHERFEGFDDELLSGFKCLHPENALSEAFHKKSDDCFEKWLNQFAFLLPPEELQVVRDQWHKLPSTMIMAPQMSADRFWYIIFNLTDAHGNYLFTELANTAMISLSIFHANAFSERKFSEMNCLKNKFKTCMLAETMEANLRVKEYCKQFDMEAGGFEPTERMIELCLDRKYNFKKKDSKYQCLINNLD